MPRGPQTTQCLTLEGWISSVLRQSRVLLLVIPLANLGVDDCPAQAASSSDRARWELADSDCALRTVDHRVHAAGPDAAPSDKRDSDERVAQDGAHERIKLRAGMGSYVHFKAEIEPAAVIPELHVEVPVRSDRPGIQVLARVVLPKTRDEFTGEAVTVLVPGTVYRRVGEWQHLVVDDLPRRLDRQVRVLRTQLGSRVTARQAFVDVVVVNAYGGNGETNLEVGSPQVKGSAVVRLVNHDLPLDAPQQTRPTRDRGSLDPILSGQTLAAPARRAATPEAGATGRPSRADLTTPVRMAGDVLLVQDRPFLVQAIEHRGEPLAFLSRLGFNVVQLSRPPTAEQSAEAARLRLWFISPAPADVTEIVSVDKRYQRVLAWSLGESLDRSSLDQVADRAGRLRRDVPPSLRRPLICQADTNLHQYGRIADVVVHDRSVVGTSCDLARTQRWLEQRMQLTNPETPHWTTVQTQLPPTVIEQAEIVTGRPVPRDDIEALQLKRLVLRGVASGMRGFLFRSHVRLDGSSAGARRRSASLSAMNSLLRILQPWAAAGRVVGQAQCPDPRVTTAVLRTNRAHLLLALRAHPTDQYVASVAKRQPLQLTTSSGSASGQVYLIGNTTVSSLVRQRVAGGSQIQLPEFANEAIVVVSDDRLVARRIYQQVSAGASTWVAWRQQMAQQTVAEASHVASQTPPLTGKLRLSDSLGEAQRLLAEGNQYLKRGQLANADRLIDSSLEIASEARLALWHRAVDDFPHAAATPLCASLTSLPLHWQVSRRFAQATLGQNILPAGDFEQLSGLDAAGWQPLELSPEDVETELALTSRGAYQGQYALRLSAKPVGIPAQRSVLAVPPVWVQSPSMALHAGQVVRIHGWVRVREPVTGSQDGVMLFDTLGGPALAYRLHATDDWQEFTMYRAAEVDSQLVLTIALTGLGEVLVDGLTVHSLLHVTPAGGIPATAGVSANSR